MKKIIIFSALVAILVVGFLLFTDKSNLKPQNTEVQNFSTSPSVSPVNDQSDIKASFTIITGSITRNFKAQKYHNKSADVYIEAPDPTIVHVTKSGITWDDFFKTLPMKLTKDCLVTGDGETLCNGTEGSIKFYLNDIEAPDLLDKEIKEGDKALIKFT